MQGPNISDQAPDPLRDLAQAKERVEVAADDYAAFSVPETQVAFDKALDALIEVALSVDRRERQTTEELKAKWLGLAEQQMQWSDESDAKGDGANSHTERARARIYRECAADLDDLVAEVDRRERVIAPQLDMKETLIADELLKETSESFNPDPPVDRVIAPGEQEQEERLMRAATNRADRDADPRDDDRSMNWGDWKPCSEHPGADHELVCFECHPELAKEFPLGFDLCGLPCEQLDDCGLPCVRPQDHDGRHECKTHTDQ